MSSESTLPFPIWLPALDVLATAALACGLIAWFAPGLAGTLGLTAALAWPLVILGGFGVIACGIAFARHRRSRPTPLHNRPRT